MSALDEAGRRLFNTFATEHYDEYVAVLQRVHSECDNKSEHCQKSIYVMRGVHYEMQGGLPVKKVIISDDVLFTQLLDLFVTNTYTTKLGQKEQLRAFLTRNVEKMISSREWQNSEAKACALDNYLCTGSFGEIKETPEEIASGEQLAAVGERKLEELKQKEGHEELLRRASQIGQETLNQQNEIHADLFKFNKWSFSEHELIPLAVSERLYAYPEQHGNECGYAQYVKRDLQMHAISRFVETLFTLIEDQNAVRAYLVKKVLEGEGSSNMNIYIRYTRGNGRKKEDQLARVNERIKEIFNNADMLSLR